MFDKYIEGLLKSSIETREDYLLVKAIQQEADETYGVQLTPEQVVKAVYEINLEKSKQRQEEESFQKSLQDMSDNIFEEYGVRLSNEEVHKALIIKAIETGHASLWPSRKEVKQYKSDKPEEHEKHGPAFSTEIGKERVGREKETEGKVVTRHTTWGHKPHPSGGVGELTKEETEKGPFGETVSHKTPKVTTRSEKATRELTEEEKKDSSKLKNKLVQGGYGDERRVVKPSGTGTEFQKVAREIEGKKEDGRKGVKHESISHGRSEIRPQELLTKETREKIEGSTGKKIKRGKRKMVMASAEAAKAGAISKRTHKRVEESAKRAKEKEKGAEQKAESGRGIRIQGQQDKPEEGKVSRTIGSHEAVGEKKKEYSEPMAKEVRKEVRENKPQPEKKPKEDEDNPYGETPEQLAREKRREER